MSVCSGSKVQCCRTGDDDDLRREVGGQVDRPALHRHVVGRLSCRSRPASFSGSWWRVKKTGAASLAERTQHARPASRRARRPRSPAQVHGGLIETWGSRPCARSSRQRATSWAVSLWSGVKYDRLSASGVAELVLPRRTATGGAGPRRRSRACPGGGWPGNVRLATERWSGWPVSEDGPAGRWRARTSSCSASRHEDAARDTRRRRRGPAARDERSPWRDRR